MIHVLAVHNSYQMHLNTSVLYAMGPNTLHTSFERLYIHIYKVSSNHDRDNLWLGMLYLYLVSDSVCHYRTVY